MPDAPKPREVHCSFCGKSQRETETMIQGPVLTAICTECVFQCLGHIAEKRVGSVGDRIDFAGEALRLKLAITPNACLAADLTTHADTDAQRLIEGTLRLIAMLALKYHNEESRKSDG